jgi:predicted RecA/RadA family phage recombinase
MQATYIQCGERIDYTPVSAVVAGQVIANEGRVVIATGPIAAGALGSVATTGLFDAVKVTGAINFLAALYWDADANPVSGTAGSGALTTTSAGNTFAGFAAAAALETDATVKLLLVGVPAITNTIHNALTAVLADPGSAGAIPVTDSGHVDIVTAAAETRTLAAPTYVGQLLLVSLKTDGGDCVIAVATGINQTGNNQITLNDAGDAVLLVGKANGANKRWSVVSNDGATLATV